jgi:hypothetical protein
LFCGEREEKERQATFKEGVSVREAFANRETVHSKQVEVNWSRLKMIYMKIDQIEFRVP